MVKNPPANAGDAGVIPGSGRSPGEVNGIPLSFSALRISLSEESGGLQFIGSQSQTWIEQLSTNHTYVYIVLHLSRQENIFKEEKICHRFTFCF